MQLAVVLAGEYSRQVPFAMTQFVAALITCTVHHIQDIRVRCCKTVTVLPHLHLSSPKESDPRRNRHTTHDRLIRKLDCLTVWF